MRTGGGGGEGGRKVGSFFEKKISGGPHLFGGFKSMRKQKKFRYCAPNLFSRPCVVIFLIL